MALKAVLILTTIGFVWSQSHCSAFEDGTNDGRDCSCADRSFNECAEPVTGAKLPVANLEECNSLCSAWSDCAWFIFDRSEHLNCRMFSTGQETMADYLSSCNRVGGPLRNEEDTCLGDLPDFLCGDDILCPGGCSSCSGDKCNDFAETECTITSMLTWTASSINFDQCQNECTAKGSSDAPINYFTHDQRAEICEGYQSGERICNNVVAAKNTDIQSCQTGIQRL